MVTYHHETIQSAADRLEAAARADNRVFDTTPREERDHLNQPAYADPYVNGVNMLSNAAYIIGLQDGIILEQARELLTFWKQRKASQEADPEFSTRAWDDADAELTDDRIKALEEVIERYN